MKEISLEEVLDLMLFKIQTKKEVITELRKEIRNKRIVVSPTQLLILRRRKNTLIKEVKELQREYDELNPDNE